MLATAVAPGAIRIKDIAHVQGIRSQQLIGYGLVVGLNGSGDTQRSPFTIQSCQHVERFASMWRRPTSGCATSPR